MAREISNSDDYIDSRDVDERIEELEEIEQDDEQELDEWDQEELDNLRKLKEQCEGYSNWKYGETLIRESALQDYVQEFCEDCGYISKDFPWWIEIDWGKTADNVSQDYTTVDFDGVDYYIRS